MSILLRHETIRLHKCGFSPRAIGKRLGMNHKTVAGWIHSYHELGYILCGRKRGDFSRGELWLQYLTLTNDEYVKQTWKEMCRERIAFLRIQRNRRMSRANQAICSARGQASCRARA